MKKRRCSTYSSEQISYTNDIIKEVLRMKQWKFSPKVCQEVIELLFDYIAYESKQNDVFAFDIPHIGHLYANEHYLKNARTKMPLNSPEREKAEEELQQLKRFADENSYKNPHKMKPLLYQYMKKIESEYEIDDNQRKMDRPSLQILSAIEDKQNRDFKIKR